MHGKGWGDGKGGEWELVRGEITGGLGYIRVAVYSNPSCVPARGRTNSGSTRADNGPS